MRRMIALLLTGAMMLLMAACAEEQANVAAQRTATPMESITPEEAVQIAAQEAEAGAAEEPEPAPSGGRTESPLAAASAGRTESPLEAASAGRTESPLETASADRTESPLQTAAEEAEVSASQPMSSASIPPAQSASPEAEVSEAVSAQASASPPASATKIGAATSATVSSDAPTTLTRRVSIPGDLSVSVDPAWNLAAIRDSKETGIRVYDVDSGTQFMLTYQEVGSILGSNQDRNSEILDKLVQAQGLWIGSERMRHVDSASTNVTYAWNSQFGQTSDLLSSQPNVTQVAAFSDGLYLYVAVWLTADSLDASSAQWNAFLDSMELAGAQVWTDMSA